MPKARKTTKNKKTYWFTEKFSKGEEHRHRIIKNVVTKTTKFQAALIADTYSFGRCLILDGEVQSAEVDEFIYHEALVHPAMLSHPNPEKVLIMGGGEGATLREVLKYKSVKEVFMLDIDGEVVDFCKKYLYSWHKGAFSDSRAKIIIDDARKYIIQTKEKFDVIISDLPCPIKKGPACLLYTKEFYQIVASKLKSNGVLVIQSGSMSLTQIELCSLIYSTVKKVFPIRKVYSEFIPSFDVPWAFIIATKKNDPEKISKMEIDRRIKNRIKGKLKFYDGYTHAGIFNIAKNLRDIFSKQKKIICKKNLFFFYK
ncbi:polyamine aminopropyltransferase [bacterium]|nr:polyamine aminopropyltransferase [bacterium]